MSPVSRSRSPRRAALSLALCASLALLAPGCLTRGRTAEMGKKEAANVAQAMGLVEDAELNAYVTAIGDRLAANADDPDTEYVFHIVDTPEPNAFALPGGYIFVSRGLLTLVNSEDQLAGVIGHEIGHVKKNHSAKRIGVASPFAIATGLAGFATGIVSPRLANAVVGTSSAITDGLFVSPFSRQQEREADSVGLKLAAESGWDPGALSEFLHILDQDTTLEAGEERNFHFRDSHPLTPERVADTAEEARKLTRADVPPIAADRAALLVKLDGLIVGKDPVGGVFQENRFLQPDMGFVIDFPNEWETMNGRSAVIAQKPDGEAVTGVEITGRGNDPWEQVRKEEERRGKALPVTELMIGDLKAVNTRTEIKTRDGKKAVDVTWIAYGGLIYGVFGITDAKVIDGYSRTFEAFANSFRPIEPDEIASIQESRLRVAEPSSGESLPDLVKRAQSDWSVEKTAIANELDAAEPLSGGKGVKVSVPQQYTSRKPAAAR